MIKNISLLSFFLLCLQSVFAQSFQGVWSGTLEVGDIKLPTVFEFHYDGEWKGTMQSPSQSPAKFPISSIRADGDSIHVELKSFMVKYVGKLSDDKMSIRGMFQQGPRSVPLDLKKGNLVAYVRPQRVTPPYSYDTLEVSVPNKIDNVNLAGTISKPRSAGKHPAVVLVTGSGPQDRNSTIFGHESFKVIADYLTKRGIVVLRYDDRGVGASGGNYSKGTTSDFAKDALSAVNYLSKQAGVNPKQVGIIGHSEGGLISTILAGQQVPNLSFIVDLAGPAIPMDSLMILQNEAIMRAQGMRVTEQDKKLILKNYEIVKSDLPSDEALEALLANMSAVPNSQNAEFRDELAVLVTPWYRYFLKIDPIPFIRKIKIPVFAAFAGKDVQVVAAENRKSLSDNLPKNSKNVIKVYAGLNHLFQTAKTGSHTEYGQIEETFNVEVLNDISTWINSLNR